MTARPSSGPVFDPFADESRVQTIGGLSLENGRDRVAIQGTLDLTRDRRGLERARALKAVLDAAVARLEGEALPDEIAEVEEKPVRVGNPFA